MRFAGKVGYGTTVESSPGVWTDDIVERTLYGDVVRAARSMQEGEQLNDNLTVSNSISVVADAFARDHFFAIRFVVWQGVAWRVSNVDVRLPRLTLQLGEVYNGPRQS